MQVRNIIIWVVVLVIIIGSGLYIANMVKENPREMDCVLGLGPKDSPTLCYGWSQITAPGPST